MTRPAPPDDYDDNPPLDDAFWSNAKPTKEALEMALQAVIEAHKTGRNEPLKAAVEAAENLLSGNA